MSGECKMTEFVGRACVITVQHQGPLPAALGADLVAALHRWQERGPRTRHDLVWSEDGRPCALACELAEPISLLQTGSAYSPDGSTETGARARQGVANLIQRGVVATRSADAHIALEVAERIAGDMALLEPMSRDKVRELLLAVGLDIEHAIVHGAADPHLRGVDPCHPATEHLPRSHGGTETGEVKPGPGPLAARDANRCAWCGWPLKDSIAEGCVRGNCAQRPLPRERYDPERAASELAGILDFTRVAVSGFITTATKLSDSQAPFLDAVAPASDTKTGKISHPVIRTYKSDPSIGGRN